MTDLSTLERELATEAARSDIECHCRAETHSGQYFGTWYDTASTTPDDVEWVQRAIKYLNMRGILHRHPHNPALVRFKS